MQDILADYISFEYILYQISLGNLRSLGRFMTYSFFDTPRILRPRIDSFGLVATRARTHSAPDSGRLCVPLSSLQVYDVPGVKRCCPGGSAED